MCFVDNGSTLVMVSMICFILVIIAIIVYIIVIIGFYYCYHCFMMVMSSDRLFSVILFLFCCCNRDVRRYFNISNTLVWSIIRLLLHV